MSAGEAIISDRLKELTWTLVERQSAAETRDGGGAVVTWGRPYWTIRARYEFGPQDDAAHRALTAWLSRRKGARVSFTAYRADRPAPVLAPGITNSGLGVSAVSISNGTVTLTGLGSTQISPGDMVGFYTASSGYWVGEATASASPSGGTATVSVWPYPQAPHGSTPNVRLLQALGEFQLIGPPSLSETSERRRAVAFEAKQVVRT